MKCIDFEKENKKDQQHLISASCILAKTINAIQQQRKALLTLEEEMICLHLEIEELYIR